MGNVIGTSALQYAINTEVIDPLILDYLRGAMFLSGLVRSKDIAGAGSLTAKFGSFGGATAAGTTPGTDLTPATWNMASDGTITAGEVGVAVEATRLGLLATGGRVNEDDVARGMAQAVAAKIETDLATLFASFGSGVGSTGVAMSVATFEDAMLAMRVANAPTVVPPNFNLPPQFAGYQMVLAEKAFSEFVRSLRQAGLTDAFLPPERAGLAYEAGSVAAGALRGVYQGIKVYGSNYASKINGNADYASSMFCPAALGLATVGVFTDRQPHVLGRSTYIVGSSIHGVGVIKDVFGQKIVSAA